MALIPCAVRWCVAFAAVESQHCAIHRRFEKLRPDPLDDGEKLLPGEWHVEGQRCKSCAGTGRCDLCNGRGDHSCDDLRCNTSHTCGACDGEGHCEDCYGSGWESYVGAGFNLLDPNVSNEIDVATVATWSASLRFNLLPTWLPPQELPSWR